MKKIIFVLFFALAAQSPYAQGPLAKQWDYRYGSPESEHLFSMFLSADSGLVLVGRAVSQNSGGDITDSSRGYEDMWIVKTDKNGLKQWDKRYGAARQDNALDGVQTPDGGFLFAGLSESDSGWEKSQDNRDPSLQTADIWVVKTDAAGARQWDRRFGGNAWDDASKIIATSDGNFLVGGTSASDANGDKTQYNQGTFDIWLIKFDINGNKIWDRRFGGAGAEYLYGLAETAQHEYMILGSSYSPVGGDKLEPNRDPTNNTGDFWILKIDQAGNKIWDKTFGGDNDDFPSGILFVDDNRYIVIGSSKSGISGDRTIANYDPAIGFNATYDFWLVLMDSSGNKTGEKVFGGNSYDEYPNIMKLRDGNYLISGDSYSPISGDKSENNFGGPEETWLIKTDTNFTKLWDKTIFTLASNHDDESGFALQSHDGCLVIKNFTNAGAGGYKSQPNWDPTHNTTDYWIVKFCDTTATGEAVNEIDGDIVISFSPNPFTDKLNLTIEKGDLKNLRLSVRNMLGQTVYREESDHTGGVFRKTLDISFLSRGVYLLEVISDGRRVIKKVVKS